MGLDINGIVLQITEGGRSWPRIPRDLWKAFQKKASSLTEEKSEISSTTRILT